MKRTTFKDIVAFTVLITAGAIIVNYLSKNKTQQTGTNSTGNQKLSTDKMTTNKNIAIGEETSNHTVIETVEPAPFGMEVYGFYKPDSSTSAKGSLKIVQ